MNSMLTTQEAAKKFNIAENTLYKTLRRYRKQNNPIIEISGSRFIIYHGTARIYLIPTEFPDIEKIEKAVALDFINNLSPLLCPDCAAALTKFKGLLR